MDPIPDTLLRAQYERCRDLDPGGQMDECIEHLRNPHVLMRAMLDAFPAIASCFAPLVLSEPEEITPDDPPPPPQDPRHEFFYPSRDLVVLNESCSFTCLATEVDPLGPLRPTPPEAEDADEATSSPVGLDFLGVTCDLSATPILGVVQSERDSSPFPLLLRLLASLTECAPPKQLRQLNRRHFKGLLRERPGFDLNLVIFDETEDDETAELTPLCELTRDLAEVAKIALLGQDDMLVRHIVCLRMNPRRFDGRLRLAWRV